MPISPTPPSGANTSSSEGRTMSVFRSTRLGGGRHRGREHIAGGDRRRTTVGRAQHEGAGLVERLETADELALGKAHAYAFAYAARAGKPVGADGRKALAGIPLRDAPEHFDRQRAEQRGGRNRGARGGEIGRGKVGVRRVTPAIDANADGDRVHVALPFDQDAGEFSAGEQEIVRPFD